MAEQLQAHSRVTAKYTTPSGKVLNLGVFETLSGGGSRADGTKIYPGSMSPQKAIGGLSSVENVTVSRTYDPDRDDAFKTDLRAGVGGGLLEIWDQPVDGAGAARGKADYYSGTLEGFTPPERDAGSSDAARFELECSTHGTVG